ncbi:HEAT repeat domain-containing protein [Micromonospora sp. GCM10011542]|uniref:HEAT repeat domain-containing protein n=1 Tax=Micromonospora sp. GCM10011542 TaxID=3317337 RepID=UPI00361E970A
MNSHEVAELFQQAVAASQRAVQLAEHDESWELLRRAAGSGAAAVRVAVTQLADPQPTVRAAACDLLGLASELHEQVRGDAAAALVDLAAAESDPDVHWSIARALGATGDGRAVPVLVALAGSRDADVRFRVATALPGVLGAHPEGPGVAALIALCDDLNPEVRNWATFALGRMSTADGEAVRQALWERTRDEHRAVRQEGVRGLARRRDARALPLVRVLLAEDKVAASTFEAAAFLAHPWLLPLLRGFDPADDGVAEALRECDPLRRVHRDETAWRLLEALHELRPDLDGALLGERFDLGLRLEVAGGPGNRAGYWFVEELLTRAGGDPYLAAQLAVDDVSTT